MFILFLLRVYHLLYNNKERREKIVFKFLLFFPGMHGLNLFERHKNIHQFVFILI